MSAELKKILTLKEIRLRREERLRQSRHRQARQCELAAQALRDGTQHTENAKAALRRQACDRWRDLFSEPFDGQHILRAHEQDEEIAQRLAHLDAALQDLQVRLADSQARLEQATAAYRRGLRKLEASKTLAAWQERIAARRQALQAECLAEELHGARHAR